MANRDRKLFEIFVRENQGALVAYLRSIVRDPSLAEDLFQETMLTAWKKFDEFDATRPLGPWLRGIAANQARNAKRKRAKEHVLADDTVLALAEETIARIETRPGDTWTDRLSALKGCLDKLPADARQLIGKRYEQGYSAEAIASDAKRPAATIRKRLQRIRSDLFTCLQKQHGATSG